MQQKKVKTPFCPEFIFYKRQFAVLSHTGLCRIGSGQHASALPYKLTGQLDDGWEGRGVTGNRDRACTIARYVKSPAPRTRINHVQSISNGLCFNETD